MLFGSRTLIIRCNRATVEKDMDKLDKTYLRKGHGYELGHTSESVSDGISSAISRDTSKVAPRITSDTRLIMSAAAATASQDDWIRVTSRDGFSFIVKRNVVFRSGTLRNMLDERRTSLHAHTARPAAHATLPR